MKKMLRKIMVLMASIGALVFVSVLTPSMNVSAGSVPVEETMEQQSNMEVSPLFLTHVRHAAAVFANSTTLVALGNVASGTPVMVLGVSGQRAHIEVRGGAFAGRRVWIDRRAVGI